MKPIRLPWLAGPAAIVIILLISNPTYGQRLPPDPMLSMADLESLCRSEPCRHDMMVQLRLADGRIREETATLYRPPILPGSVSVLLEDEIEAVPEFDRDGNFANWRESRRRESTRTPVLSFSLSQENDGSMAASIGNSGRDPVKVDLYLRAPGSSQFEYTSTCPIIAGGTVFEYWNQPVVEMQVRSARIVSEDSESALLCD